MRFKDQSPIRDQRLSASKNGMRARSRHRSDCDQFAATKRVYHHGHSSVKITNLNGAKILRFAGPRAADHGLSFVKTRRSIQILVAPEDLPILNWLKINQS